MPKSPSRERFEQFYGPFLSQYIDYSGGPCASNPCWFVELSLQVLVSGKQKTLVWSPVPNRCHVLTEIMKRARQYAQEGAPFGDGVSKVFDGPRAIATVFAPVKQTEIARLVTTAFGGE